MKNSSIVRSTWIPLLISLSLFSGCDPLSRNTQYTLINQRGERIDYSDDEIYDYYAGGQSVHLNIIRASESQRSQFLGFIIETEDYGILYDFSSDKEGYWGQRMRGFTENGDKFYVILEHWKSGRHDGYIDKTLAETVIYGFSIETGKEIIQQRAGKDELVLMVRGNLAYIYCQGKVYARPLGENWDEQTELCDFGFYKLEEIMREIVFDMSDENIIRIYMEGLVSDITPKSHFDPNVFDHYMDDFSYKIPKALLAEIPYLAGV